MRYAPYLMGIALKMMARTTIRPRAEASSTVLILILRKARRPKAPVRAPMILRMDLPVAMGFQSPQ